VKKPCFRYGDGVFTFVKKWVLCINIYHMIKETETRKCRVCKEVKTLSDYYTSGTTKLYHSRSCKKCVRAIANAKQKKLYSECYGCYSPKSINTVPLCSACRKVVSSEARKVKRSRETSVKELKYFIKKIEERKGQASISEIFVELITLYGIYGKDNISHFPVGKQILTMWERLQKIDIEYRKK